MSIFDKYDNIATEEIDRAEVADYHYADPEKGDEEEIAQSTNPRFSWIHIAVAAAVVALLIGRLVYIQVVNGGVNASLAKQHSIRQTVVPASRGNILDSRGLWLARNAPSFRVQVLPSDLPRKKADRSAIYDSLASVLQWSSDDKKHYTDLLEGKLLFTIDPIILKEGLNHDDALVLTEKTANLAGVSVVPQQVRQYSETDNGLSSILGYVGRISEQDLTNNAKLHSVDAIGKSGIESSYDQQLRGQDGIEQAVVDSKGKLLRTVTDSSNNAVPGYNLSLHIDSKLQTIMYQQLSQGLSKAGIPSGVAIAMNPQDGSILGMVSLPTYDNNQFANGIPADVYSVLTKDPNKPLFDRATMGTYASGSTIKPFVASVGLQDGVITENTRIDTPAEIVVGQQHFPNWQHFSIPGVDVKTALEKSNDVFFYAVGGGFSSIPGLGGQRLADGLKMFGFNQKTGVDLPNEAVGVIPDANWEKQHNNNAHYYIGDVYHTSIGQGDLLVTPLQLVTALSAVANGGTLYQPHIVDRVVNQDGKTVQTIAPQVVRSHFIDDKNIQIVRDGLRQTVTNGTGRQLQDLPVSSGAKTGTAQFGPNNEFLHSWFEAFAPYDNPSIAIVVLGEKGSQQNEGNTTSEPIVNEILKQYFSPDFKK